MYREISMKNWEKILLSSALFLFTAWLTVITVKWNDLQIIRQHNPLWLIDVLYPYIFIIIICLVLLISISIWANLQSIWLHTALLTILTLVLLCTPYYIGAVARFPDTFGVASSVENLSTILNSSTDAYASDYPLAYILFYIVNNIAGIALLEFSQNIFSPAVLIFFILLWYLFIRRVSTPRIAFLAASLAIPALIVEVTISPNSVGMVLVLSALLLLAIGTMWGKILMLLLSATLVLVHPLNIIMFAAFLISFELTNQLTKRRQREKKIGVPIISMLLIFVGWFMWSMFESSRGSHIIRIVLDILTTKPSSIGGGDSASGGGISTYSFIQEIMLSSYSIYAVVGIIVILCTIVYCAQIIFKKKKPDPNGLFGTYNLMPYMLWSSIILFAMTFASYFFVGEGEQIVSRSMNYGMLSLSVCISIFIFYVFASLRKAGNEKMLKYIACSIIIMFIFVSVAYPIHAYSRESYISYTESHIAGTLFYSDYRADLSSQDMKIFNSNSKNNAIMKSDYRAIVYENKMNDIRSSLQFAHTYTNNHYDIFMKNYVP